MLLYTVHRINRITFQYALLSYQFLKRTSKNVITENHNASYRGMGKTVQDPLAPTLGGRLASHAHYLKQRGFWKKYVMSLNLNHRRY